MAASMTDGSGRGRRDQLAEPQLGRPRDRDARIVRGVADLRPPRRHARREAAARRIAIRVERFRVIPITLQ